MKRAKYRAVQFTTNGAKGLPLLDVLWGMDIWYGSIPFCKTILLANILIWILFN